MRKLKCHDIGGMSVHDMIDEFNERGEEFGIADADIVSIATRSASTDDRGIVTAKGKHEPSVIVSIFYWSDGD